MMADIEHCERMIARENQLAEQAPTPEAAESHLQLSMLYRIQLYVLQCRTLDGAVTSVMQHA